MSEAFPYTGRRSSRSTPTGLGSRGGTWHLPGVRNAYFRAWRAAHPGYYRLGAMRERAANACLVPVVAPIRKARLTPTVLCRCGCGCRGETIATCGFCRDGLHS